MPGHISGGGRTLLRNWLTWFCWWLDYQPCSLLYVPGICSHACHSMGLLLKLLPEINAKCLKGKDLCIVANRWISQFPFLEHFLFPEPCSRHCKTSKKWRMSYLSLQIGTIEQIQDNSEQPTGNNNHSDCMSSCGKLETVETTLFRRIRRKEIRVSFPALPFVSHMGLEKQIKLPEPQFPPLQTEDNIYLQGMVRYSKKKCMWKFPNAECLG